MKILVETVAGTKIQLEVDPYGTSIHEIQQQIRSTWKVPPDQQVLLRYKQHELLDGALSLAYYDVKEQNSTLQLTLCTKSDNAVALDDDDETYYTAEFCQEEEEEEEEEGSLDWLLRSHRCLLEFPTRVVMSELMYMTSQMTSNITYRCYQKRPHNMLLTPGYTLKWFHHPEVKAWLEEFDFESIIVLPHEVERYLDAIHCDIWACGVIAFTLLSGNPPFEQYNDKHVEDRIFIENVEFHDPIWETISELGKDFITKCLTIHVQL